MSTIGIILAAGKGTRLGYNIPKALLPVCGVSILETQVNMLHSLCDTIVVVCGFKHSLVTAHAQNLGRRYDVDLHTVVNKHYSLGVMISAHSSLCFVNDEDTVLRMDGDLYVLNPEQVKSSMMSRNPVYSPLLGWSYSRPWQEAVHVCGPDEVKIDRRSNRILMGPIAGQEKPSWSCIDRYHGQHFKALVQDSVLRSSTEPMYRAINLAVEARRIPPWTLVPTGGLHEIDVQRDIQYLERHIGCNERY